LSRMRAARRPRRALLILSDGMDNQSRYSKSDLMRIAIEADVHDIHRQRLSQRYRPYSPIPSNPDQETN